MVPRVDVRIEVDDSDGPVDFVQGAEDRIDDRVISTERHETGVLLTIQGELRSRSAITGEVRSDRTGQKCVVGHLDLLKGEGVIVRRDRNVTTVDNFGSLYIRVATPRNRVTSSRGMATRAGSNSERPEAARVV
jgi:hypothetical protein